MIILLLLLSYVQGVEKNDKQAVQNKFTIKIQETGCTDRVRLSVWKKVGCFMHESYMKVHV